LRSHRLTGGLALAVTALLAGCSKKLDPPVAPEDAAGHLKAALTAWKAGEPFESLGSRTPPIVFNEPLYRGGTKLADFELGEVTLYGRQARCSVKLTLAGADAKKGERKIGYLIDTTPNVVITREGMGE
jgi:hypothetical protein